jgi:hypothetical protein
MPAALKAFKMMFIAFGLHMLIMLLLNPFVTDLPRPLVLWNGSQCHEQAPYLSLLCDDAQPHGILQSYTRW